MTETFHRDGSILEGLLLCWGMNFVLVLIGCSVAWTAAERPGGSNVVSIAGAIVLSVGLLQLLYVIPLSRVLKEKGKIRTVKGLTIAAWTTALLNAAWLVLKAEQHIL